MTNWSNVKRALKGTSAAVHSERLAGAAASLDGHRVLRPDEPDRDVLAEHALRARLEQAAEALGDPRAALVGRGDDERRAVEAPSVERVEVEMPRGVRDRVPELGPNAPPGMLEFVVGHDGRGGSSSPGEVGGSVVREGPRRTPVARI